MKRLSKQQILLLHTQMLHTSGGRTGVRDDGLLDSALHAPFQTFEGIDLYPDLLSKASRLGYGLIQNHPFIDGNKRIGTHVMLVFLSINGISVEYEDADLIKTVLSVADGTCDEQQFLAWLRQHVSAEKG